MIGVFQSISLIALAALLLGRRRAFWLMHCRSFYYAGVFQGGLELFFAQLVNGQLPDQGLFDRFLIQCMLFHHAVLTCPSYKGTSGSFELTSAARAQVSLAADPLMSELTTTIMTSM